MINLARLQPSLRVGVARFLSVTVPLQEKSINRVQLLGRVGRDPEQRGPIVYFPLATTHVVRSSAEEENGSSERSITTWHAVTVGSAAFGKYVQDFVTKGTRVLVDGSLSYYKSTTPDETVKHTAVVRARELIILSAPRHDIAVPSGSQYADDGDFHPTSEPELR